jgi:hypothetical protein
VIGTLSRSCPARLRSQQLTVLFLDRLVTLTSAIFQTLYVQNMNFAREYLIMPAVWSVCATAVTLVRRTPSISARNSWVKGKSSLADRSRARNIHRQSRASISWFAMQAVDCCACAKSACSWRITIEIRCSDCMATLLKAAGSQASASPGNCVIARLNAIFPSSAEAMPMAPSFQPSQPCRFTRFQVMRSDMTALSGNIRI